MKVELVGGFLGVGKTTLIKGLIEHWSGREKLAVLVNEFGEVGIDGTLLAGRGTEVVELASGCICCTLNADLKAQVSDIALTYQPEHLLIEPTGIATTKSILNILGSLSLEKFITAIRVTLLLDGLSYGSDSRLFSFIDSQIALADLVVLNKSDLVLPQVISEIRHRVASINPQAKIIQAKYGREAIEAMVNDDREPVDVKTMPNANEDDTILFTDYQSLGVTWQGVVTQERLLKLFDKFKDRDLGEIMRAKGFFLTDEDRWIVLDFVQGQIYQEWSEGKSYSESRLTVIGKELRRDLIDTAIEACRLIEG
ncbi:putative metal chaperone YciC [Peptococcaceae bacterium CEB3]|nr:putative metal chaperone YciC [Peptococcaceae bacterium CEB3]